MSKKKKNDLVDYDVVLSSLTDDVLKLELESRDYVVLEDDEYKALLSDVDEGYEDVDNGVTSLPSTYFIERTYAFGDNLREHLLDITGQGHYVTNEELLNGLRDLL